MVAICCFQCDPRLATYAIAVFSILHFGVETILLIALDEDHRLVAEDDGIKFYTVFATHLYDFIASVPLFLAAFHLRTSLCIPWLIGCCFTLLLYLAILMLVILRILNTFDLAEMEKAFFLVFTMSAMVCAIWVVVIFKLEVDGDNYTLGTDSKAQDTSGRAKSRSRFTLYDGDDSESEEDLFAPRKSQSKTNKKKKKHKKNDRIPLLHNP